MIQYKQIKLKSIDTIKLLFIISIFVLAVGGVALSIDSSSAAEVHVNDSMNNSMIQQIINENLSDGDTLLFDDGIFENIGLIINKSINIIGSPNTLIKAIVDWSTFDNKTLNETLTKYSKIDGPAAFLFVDGSSNSNISNLNITSMPGFDYLINSSASATKYNKLICAVQNTTNLSIYNNYLNNSCWGIFLTMYTGATTMSVYNNVVTNMADTGIINFGAGAAVINNNTISNVGRHGIDVRHPTCNNTIVSNNTIINASEGIYTMHSSGHKFINNTIINTTLSGITAYGSHNVLFENNTMLGGIVGILLEPGSGTGAMGSNAFSNITLKNNTFNYTPKSGYPSFGYGLIVGDSSNCQYLYNGVTNSTIGNGIISGVYTDSSQLPSNINISSSYDKTSITNGESVKYTVKVSNTGEGSASNITIDNILPKDVKANSVILTNGKFSNGKWTIDSLSGNTNATLVFYAKPSKSGTFNNIINGTYNDNLHQNSGNDWVDFNGTKTTLTVDKDIKVSSSSSLSSSKIKKAKYFYITTKIKNTGLDNSSKLTSKISTSSGLKIASVSKSSYATYNKNSKTWTVKSVPSKKTVTLKVKVKATKKGTQKVKVNTNGKSTTKSVKVV